VRTPILQPGVVAPRLQQMSVLLRPLRTAVRWQPLLGATVLVVVLLAVKADDLHQDGTALMVLRGVAALLALGAAFLIDDAAAVTLAASPTSLAWRRLHRLLVAALVTVPWTLAVLVVRSRGAETPVAGLTLELVTLVALALAAAGGITRWTGICEPGVLAAPLVCGLILASFQVPERWALLAWPGTEWEAAHQRWGVLLGAAVLVLAWCTCDPARRGAAARLDPGAAPHHPGRAAR
jgi:hypothetical protein